MTYIPSQTFPDAARQAEVWVAELAEQLHCELRQAYDVLRSVLHAVRDCLSLQEGVDLANHLPVLLRGLFYENWHPTDAKRAQARADLTVEVSKRLKQVEFDAKKVLEEFFKLLEHRLNPKGLAKLDMMLSESWVIGERRSEKLTGTDIDGIGKDPTPLIKQELSFRETVHAGNGDGKGWRTVAHDGTAGSCARKGRAFGECRGLCYL
ncbi:DUF2267 domain-containing protein (plasmid) [Rhizobium sp. CB3090]|uniref:DUF2267 domain-containing protein n=1 Tax=Rhizobium sp. CB3090 TaxID=3039156 RepID=UPI0024B0C34C|nr:DUF2267 domain-containing protein [Rhizobium sp. CB3090]WFU13245.1 DUF2267 domain-containing protein [Rhizobium sp. CB3090]